MKAVSISIALLAGSLGSGCLSTGISGGTGATGGDEGTSTGNAGSTTTGGGPAGIALSIAPNPIDFGPDGLGRTAVGCTTVTNPGSGAVQILGAGGFTNDAGIFALSQVDGATPPNPAPVPATIAGGASAPVCFGFTPTVTQQYAGSATLETSDGLNPAVQLTGWGAGPRIACTPTSIDYGQTLSHSVTTVPILCTNVGSAVPGEGLMVQSFAFVGPGASDWSGEVVGGEPPDGFQPGQTFQVDLHFMPGDGGDGDATCVMESNGGEVEIALTGFDGSLNVPPCQFVVAPTQLNFANVPVGDDSEPLSFEIQNVGTDSCTVQGLTIDGDDAGPFHLLTTSLNPDSTGRYTIPAPASGVDSSLTVMLDFVPTLPGQTYFAEVAFSISDPSNPNQLVPLSGTSESSCLVVAPPLLNFGDAGVTDAGGFLPTPQQFFSVSNICEGSLWLQSLSLFNGPGDLTAQYSAVSGPSLPALISSGSSLSFGLSCVPTTPGEHFGQLLLASNPDTWLPLTCNAP